MSENNEQKGNVPAVDMNKIAVVGAEPKGGELFITVESFNREAWTSTVRTLAKAYIDDPANGLGAWGNAGIEKYAAPIAFDPKNPKKDPMEIQKEKMQMEKAQGVLQENKKEIQWCYRQTVKVTRMI